MVFTPTSHAAQTVAYTAQTVAYTAQTVAYTLTLRAMNAREITQIHLVNIAC